MAVERFGVSVPTELAEEFDNLIAAKGYPNRSEAIRDLMRDALVQAAWEQAEGEVVATVTLVYDHRVRTLSQALIAAQHRHDELVVCTTHVHLDECACLEVVVLRGDADEVMAMANQLISAKGVQHGKIVHTSIKPQGRGAHQHAEKA